MLPSEGVPRILGRASAAPATRTLGLYPRRAQKSESGMVGEASWEQYVLASGEGFPGTRCGEYLYGRLSKGGDAGKLNKSVIIDGWDQRAELYTRTTSIGLHGGIVAKPLPCVHIRPVRSGVFHRPQMASIAMAGLGSGRSLTIQLLDRDGRKVEQEHCLDTSELLDIPILEDPNKLLVSGRDERRAWLTGMCNIVNTAGTPVAIENYGDVLKNLNRFGPYDLSALAVVISDAILSCLLSESGVQCTCTFPKEDEEKKSTKQKIAEAVPALLSSLWYKQREEKEKTQADEKGKNKTEESLKKTEDIKVVWETCKRHTREMERSVRYLSRDSLAIAIKAVHFRDPALFRAENKEIRTLPYFDLVTYVRYTLLVMRNLNGEEPRLLFHMRPDVLWMPVDSAGVFTNAIALFMHDAAHAKALRQVCGLPNEEARLPKDGKEKMIKLSDLEKNGEKSLPWRVLPVPDLANEIFDKSTDIDSGTRPGLQAMEIGRRRILLMFDNIIEVARTTGTRAIPENGIRELSKKMNSGDFLKPSKKPLLIFAIVAMVAAGEAAALAYVYGLCTREGTNCVSTLVNQILTALGSVLVVLNVARELLCPGTPWTSLLGSQMRTRLVSDLIKEDMRREGFKSGLVVARPLDGYLTPTENAGLTESGVDLHGVVHITVGDMEDAGSIVTEGLAIVPTTKGMKMMRVEGAGKRQYSMSKLGYSKQPDEFKLYRSLQRDVKIA